MKTLTGTPAVGYIGAWMAAAARGGGLNAGRVAADALAASSSRRALVRLRLASVKARVVPVMLSPCVPRRVAVRVGRLTATRRTAHTAARSKPRRKRTA